MQEKPFFFRAHNYRLFGVLHEPPDESNKEIFIFCHPFAEEKLWSHRVYVNFARALTQRGYTVLRFDFMGHGDSDGDFSESSVQSRLSDIGSAIDYAQTINPEFSISLFGLRFGATLAARMAESRPEIKNLILWEPVLNGATYMKQLLRINLSTQSAVYKKIIHNSNALIQIMKNGEAINIDGYEITLPFYEQTNGINLVEETPVTIANTLVVEISKLSKKPNPNVQKFSQLYAKGKFAQVVEGHFWTETKSYYYKADNLFKTTIDWLIGNEI